MTASASWFVATVAMLNIAALAWLLWWMRRRQGEPAVAATDVETSGHVWDGDLAELNNPLPRWWLWLFILSVVFGLGYFVVYGIGGFSGTTGWSSQSQYREQSERAEAVLAKTFAPYAAQEVPALMQDPGALRIGRNLFLNNCAQCHGSDGRGALNFPNLADDDWLWGNAPEKVVQTITEGRNGVMVGWQPVLGDAGVDDATAYVLSLSGRTGSPGDVERGRATFTTICAACHGAQGEGNTLLGAPNLRDSIWLHGGSVQQIHDTIALGRNGQMPAHGERLGAVRVKLLAAYVLGLGGKLGSSTAAEQPVAADAAPAR